ncbi:transcription factor iiib subunit [Martelella soudanensis]|uniref:transcription factor iiib subunit n=1 Tax=unclassified Martelella TaxID=2629616 RepID=UPI0015DEF4D2|nr:MULTISPECIES: transcription factor iiib subunit [unclassified Martelella]
MANRRAEITQAEMRRYFKAAREAGFERARFVRHPDGKIEIIGEGGPAALVVSDLSPFEEWELENARKV